MFISSFKKKLYSFIILSSSHKFLCVQVVCKSVITPNSFLNLLSIYFLNKLRILLQLYKPLEYNQKDPQSCFSWK